MKYKIKPLVLLVLSMLLPVSLYADRITAGGSHNLVARSNGYIYSWGANQDGQLGDGTTLDSLNPLSVVDRSYHAVSGVIAVHANGANNIVLLDDHTMLGWGTNENWQLGSGLASSGRYLGDPGAGAGATETDGTDSGQDTGSTALDFPVPVVDPEGKPISNIIKLVTGPVFSAAIRQDGTVVVWGRLDVFADRESSRKPVNSFSDKFFDPEAEWIEGRYLNGDPVTDYDMLEMRDAAGNLIAGIVDVAIGEAHLLALTEAGTVLAWGENDAGQLGDATLHQRAYPVPVLNDRHQVLGGITGVGANGDTSIAVRADGRVMGWGALGFLQPEAFVSDGNELQRPDDPVARLLADNSGEQISRVKQIALGSSHALAITFDDTIVGWGDNSSGQLGNGTNAAVSGTSRVVNGYGNLLADITEIAVGDRHSLALRSDGQLFTWGSAENGRLGDGTNIDSYYAIKVRGQDNAPFSVY